MTVAWLEAVPAVLAAIVVLVVPGLLATAPLRLGWTARIALTSAVGVACIGAAGVMFGFAGLAFAAWQPLVPALIGMAATLAVRRLLPGLALPRERVPWWALLGAAVLAASMVAVVAFSQVPSPDRISQTYDNLFHLSAIAHILDTGDASSVTLRTLMEPDRQFSFYPAAWHSLAAATVQLTSTSVPVAVNAAWIAVVAVVWLPGAAWLAQVLARGIEPGLVALVAVPLGAAFGAMPYALLSWGTLYPTFLATAVLPAAVALPVVAWSARGTVPRRRRVAFVAVTTIAVGVLVAAIVFSQPRVLVTWLVLLAPFAVKEIWRAYRSAWVAGGRRRRKAVWALSASAVVLLVVAAAGFAYVVFRLGLFERPLDDRLGGPQAQASQSVLAGFGQVIAQAWPTGSSGGVAFPAILLAGAVLVGGVVLWRARRARWAIVSYAVLAVLFVLAAGSDDVVTKLLTALWYKDRYRLSSALPVLGIAFAAIGIIVACRKLIKRSGAARIAALAAAWLVTLSAAVTLALSGASASVGAVFRMPEEGASNEIVSARQIAFLESLDIPADQLLLGDPWDGSALSLLYGGNTPIFPHVTGQWGAQRIALAHRLQDIETDPSVCEALDALRVRYVVYNPHEFGGGDPIGNQFFGIHTAIEAGLFTPIDTDGESTLFRIDQCGELAQP